MVATSGQIDGDFRPDGNIYIFNAVGVHAS
jgi:hypothetical protein